MADVTMMALMMTMTRMMLWMCRSIFTQPNETIIIILPHMHM